VTLPNTGPGERASIRPCRTFVTISRREEVRGVWVRLRRRDRSRRDSHRRTEAQRRYLDIRAIDGYDADRLDSPEPAASSTSSGSGARDCACEPRLPCCDERRTSGLVLIQRWTGQDPGVQGASLTFRLSRRISVDADLPRADIPPDAPTTGTCHAPYRQTWLHERSEKVTEIYVLVDLDKAKVADISTNAISEQLSWVRGKPHPSCEELQNSS
jgi:hypothetical protein